MSRYNRAQLHYPGCIFNLGGLRSDFGYNLENFLQYIWGNLLGQYKQFIYCQCDIVYFLHTFFNYPKRKYFTFVAAVEGNLCTIDNL